VQTVRGNFNIITDTRKFRTMREENPALLLNLKCKLDYIDEFLAGLITPTYLLEEIPGVS
jgi:hypothetical protein